MQADVEACRGRARVIAINDVGLSRSQLPSGVPEMAPWADVLYASDAKWWRHYKGVPDFHGLKFGLMDCQWQQDGVPWPDLRVLKNTGVEGLTLDPTALRNGHNSGYAALHLAVHLGAIRILLLGYDMGVPPGSPKHFFGEHPKPLQAGSPYATFRELFATLVHPLNQIGVTVINCSRQTALKCFPRQDLEDALAGERRGV